MAIDSPADEANGAASGILGTYQQQCKHLKLKPDPSVTKILESHSAESLQELELSAMFFSPPAFEAIMGVAAACPNLKKINLSNTNLKSDCVQNLVDTVAKHPSITSIDLSNNSTLGFAAAKILLPLLKEHTRIVELEVEGTCMAAPTKELLSRVLVSNRTASGVGRVWTPEEPQRSPKASAPPPAELSATEVMPAAAPETDAPYSYFVGEEDGVGISPTRADAPDLAKVDLTFVKARNHELKSALMEHEERLNGFHQDLLVKCDSRQREINTKRKRGERLMDEFREGWKWPLKSDFCVSSCITDFALNLTEEDLAAHGKHYTSLQKPTYVHVKGHLSELLDLKTNRRRRGVLLEDILSKVRNHGCGMHLLVDVVGSFHDMLFQDGTSSEPIHKILKETDFQITEVEAKIEKLEAARQVALDDEDLQEAERLFEASLDSQEKQIDIILYRLNNLLDKTARTKLIEDLKKLCEATDEQMNETKQINDDLMGKVDYDLKKVGQKVMEEQEGMRYFEQEFVEVQKRMYEEMDNNQRQQEKVWRDITYSFTELKELSDARFKECENWMKEVEKHERRKVEYNTLLQVCDEHARTLQELMHTCVACEQILGGMDEYIRAGTRKITDLADAASNEADTLALEEQQTYLAVFRKYYLAMGELMFKKQKRLEEQDRMIRNCEFQIDFCKETLDPDLQNYREQLKELNIRREDLAKRIAEMQLCGDDRATQFMPHEDALRAAGIDFDSPLLEMHEDIVGRRAKVLNARQTFIDKDKEELLDREADEIDNLVQTTKHARETGISTLIHPLSPNKAVLVPDMSSKLPGGSRPNSQSGTIVSNGDMPTVAPMGAPGSTEME